MPNVVQNLWLYVPLYRHILHDHESFLVVTQRNVKVSHWITINYPMLAYVRKFTYLSVAKINKQNSDMTWQI